MGVLRDAMATAAERWIRGRAPRQQMVTLGHRQIFVLPNRYGLTLLALVLVLFIMGTNYQNNLVLAMAFLLAALFVLSIYLTYHNLSGLTLSAGHAESAHVGDWVRFHCHLNSRRERYGLQCRMPGSVPVWVEAVRADERAEVILSARYSQRGRQRMPRVRVETRFPFGWITGWSFWHGELSVIVWPRPVHQGLDRPSVALRQESSSASAVRSSEAPDNTRDYQPGDPLRRILWHQFARRGQLLVKVPPPVSGDSQQLDILQVADLPLEQGLQQLAYWIEQAESAHQPWSLHLGKQSLPRGSGSMHRRAGFDLLALHGSAGQGGDHV